MAGSAQILEAQLEAVRTEKERIAILGKLARLFEEEFVKPEKAAERLEQILEIDPNNLDALAGLSRIYRTLQRWDDVLNTYERHVSATPDRAEKVSIYKALGSTYANELKDPARAIDTYLNVTNLDENDVEALDALSRLYEKTDNHASSIDALERLAKLQRDPAQQVDLHYRIGRILEEKLGERNSAVRHYERAIDIDPTHLRPWRPCVGLRRRRRLAGGVAHPRAGDSVQHHAARSHALERGAGSDLSRASRRVLAVGGLLRGGPAPRRHQRRSRAPLGGRLRQGTALRRGPAALAAVGEAERQALGR